MNDRTINELEYVPRPREPDAKWAAVFSLSLGVFGLVTAEFLPVSLLTPVSLDLGISSGVAGQSITVTALVAAVAGPAVVIGTRNIDRRWTLLGLTMLLVISSILAAVANGLVMLLTSRFLLGIGLGGFWAMAGALALRLVPLDKLPRAMSIIFTGVSVATVCAAPVGAWIGATLGWRAAFVVAAVLGVMALVAQLLTVPALPPAGAPGLATMFRLLQRPQLRIGLLTTLLVVSGQFAGFTYVRPFLEDVPQFGVEAISFVLLAYGIGGFFGTIFGGFLAERNTAWAVTIAATMIAAAASVLVLAGASPVVSSVAIAFWGFAFGALPVSIQSYVTRVASDEAESAGALMLTTFQIAISSGAVLGGLLIDLHGATMVFVFVSVATLLGASLMASRRGVVPQAEASGV
ncbi:MFS transporter [Agrobacterium tumefaciens]|uniref:MFS transporter n=1 Tax=Agrobacterium tumefaciens TaxID=358 RepID=UPI00287D4529|nr:MFS transporter [Agrobacterium tumefaciens]MDS7595646.1 MFS transporter [Agrobacterium tumefaciens]